MIRNETICLFTLFLYWSSILYIHRIIASKSYCFYWLLVLHMVEWFLSFFSFSVLSTYIVLGSSRSVKAFACAK